MSGAQIIYDDTGAPAFVVIPYAAYRALRPDIDAELSDEELFDRAMAEELEPSVPHEVMMRLVDRENPLRVFREWRQLTQAELADKIGMSVGYVSQVERGVRHLSRKTRAAAAKVLGVLPSDLEDSE